MICKGATLACAKRRVALCFVQFLPALNNCTKVLREGSEHGRKLLLQALLVIHQSKLLRLNEKGPVKLKPLKNIDEIRIYSKKELMLTKKLITSKQ